MKVAVVGAGAIGGLLGSRLSLAGDDVVFLARNRNLEAIGAHGFTLLEADGSERRAPNVRAVGRGTDAGPQDVVFLTVKAHQVADVAGELPGLLGPDTSIVTMINGMPWWYFQRHGGEHEGRRLESVDPEGRLAQAIDARRVVGGIVYPAAELVAPGVVRHIEGNRFTIGEPDGARSARVEAIGQALMRAGFKAPVAKDIRGEIWIKLWGNLSFNPISALTHATLEGICRHPDGRAVAAAMMGEAQAIGEALGVSFKIGLEQRIAGAEAVGAHKTSMLQDLEAGRDLELEALLGSVVELGRLTRRPMPTLEAVYGLVKLLAATLAAQGAKLAPQPKDS